MVMVSFEHCTCRCHDNPNISHFTPCCYTCEVCGSDLILADQLPSHEIVCREKRAKHIAQIPHPEILLTAMVMLDESGLEVIDDALLEQFIKDCHKEHKKLNPNRVLAQWREQRLLIQMRGTNSSFFLLSTKRDLQGAGVEPVMNDDQRCDWAMEHLPLNLE